MRIGLSRFSATVEATAFENTDGSIAVVLLNRGNSGTDVRIRLSPDEYIPAELDAHGIATILIGR